MRFYYLFVSVFSARFDKDILVISYSAINLSYWPFRTVSDKISLLKKTLISDRTTAYKVIRKR